MTAMQAAHSERLNPWMPVVVIGIVLVATAWVVLAALRKFLRETREAHAAPITAEAPSVSNPAAFMTASMQGVIQKLREQEKELERLHRIERERAEHTERLSEEVTRNMP